MGLSEWFVAAPTAALADRDGLEAAGTHGEWRFARVPLDSEVAAMARELARELAAPVIGAFVFDSDFGEIHAASPRGGTVTLAVCEAYDEHGNDLGGQWLDPVARREAVAKLAAWAAEFAPRTPSENELLAALEAVDVFAEEGLRAVFRLLGLGDLDALVFGYGVPAAPPDPDRLVLRDLEEPAPGATLMCVLLADPTNRLPPRGLVFCATDERSSDVRARHAVSSVVTRAWQEAEREGLRFVTVVAGRDADALRERARAALAEAAAGS